MPRRPGWVSGDGEPPVHIVPLLERYEAQVRSWTLRKSEVVEHISDKEGLTPYMAECVYTYLKGDEVEPESHDSLFSSEKFVVNRATGTIVTFLESSPKPISLPISKHKAILAAYSNWSGKPATINEIARRFEFPRAWLVEYLRVHGVTHDSEPFTPDEVMEEPAEVLVEEALQAKRQKLYQAFEKEKWQSVQKDADAYRKFVLRVVEPLRETFESFSGTAPSTPKASKGKKASSGSYALITHATDLHVGMRTSTDSRDQFGVDECRERLRSRTQDIIERVSGFDVEQVFVGVGGDWLHYDGFDKMTSARKHSQESDLSWEEMFRTGIEMAVMQIEMLRSVAPVTAVSVPGNHARLSEIAMQVALECYYRDVDDVTVLGNVDHRVYTEYGTTLTCWVHGDRQKAARLPNIMAAEEPEAWGRARHRIIVNGHWHHRLTEDLGGVTQYQFPSLIGLDDYHSQSGWTGGTPGLDAILVHETQGPCQLLMSPIVRDMARGRLAA